MPSPNDVLPASFFERSTLVVARDLLGKRLCVQTAQWGRVVCRVVETEAYTQDDPACHAYGRKTGRAANLYGAPGTAYVYFIYGMYHCLNVVTEPEGQAGAVLIRGLSPISHPELNTRGPGRLTRALGITQVAHNGLPMTSRQSPLYWQNAPPVPPEAVVQTTRIGIRQAAEYPWRFLVANDPFVSVPPAEPLPF
ncbi:MAG: DNA-3-methyladenine glycosylase [Candidatus Melainabacteria bacterium]|nr:DNA-3-methyladenine glycosylase [Candidatus Melainabacteria bacterium]